MVKNYIKRDNKIYEVREIETDIADLEFHIAQIDAQKIEMEADLTAMNAAKNNAKTEYRYK